MATNLGKASHVRSGRGGGGSAPTLIAWAAGGHRLPLMASTVDALKAVLPHCMVHVNVEPAGRTK